MQIYISFSIKIIAGVVFWYIINTGVAIKRITTPTWTMRTSGTLLSY